jgi:mono/diheme cytochrome c family protein
MNMLLPKTIILARLLAACAMAAALPVATSAQGNGTQAESNLFAAGKRLVVEYCSACHATGADDQSRHPEAPPMRTLGRNYPVEDLAEALAEGIMSGHPDMPVLTFEADEVDQVIAYLQSIQVE